ncbi:radical SAM/SPASM domain-containing protein [Stenotrophomonas beteli]|uniref:Uncharacterized protein n=1 Tax=Stenotrophomonas beteli TaxID=3384461 RepID=A0A0R0AUE3_9GAMM|nr:radical SAM/SPASM domain-containing protein [Stenotrophomonas maltophilia]KRG48747.1 hypothetical protein ARC23_02680 [Stenotrophomonas maltophilia]
MLLDQHLSPRTITMITTYGCTAECRQCCFESSPRVKGRLSLEAMTQAISDAKRSFPSLLMAVFSGGEATMLKADLTAAIAHATQEGLSTRIVSNGSWGKTLAGARRKIAELAGAGLRELNLSTGKDHQEWVSAKSIMHCAVAAAEHGLFCLITIEADVEGSPHFRAVVEQKEVQALVRDRRIVIQSNSWMPFQENSDVRVGTVAKQALRKGCDQIFDNIVVTPYGEVSACCGLALEHIPEMKLGNVQNASASEIYRRQTGDFLKYWIHVDGPYRIVEQLLPGDTVGNLLKDVVHICQACVILHKNENVRARLREGHREFMSSVMTRFFLAKAVDAAGLKLTPSEPAKEALQ